MAVLPCHDDIYDRAGVIFHKIRIRIADKDKRSKIIQI